ncbi:MAG: ACP S-malonyltransferase [Bacillota bacterium]|nr:ACP S-malonyltransferase [Bacillota bacterium]
MIAFVFSGQGSQYQVMGQTLCQYSQAAQAVYDAAKALLGYDLQQLTPDQLSQTGYAQPAIVTLSMAAWQSLLAEWQESDLTGQDRSLSQIAGMAGFSLGEYSALGAAGILDLQSLLVLVSERARLMQEAAKATPGSMAAVIGLSDQQILSVLEQERFRDKVFAVNFNAPGQVVLSGYTSVLPDCLAACSQVGARRVVALDVNGAFHTPLMAQAADKLKTFAAGLNFVKTAVPLYSNVDGKLVPATVDWPDYLARHLCSPVRWVDEVRTLTDDGATAFCELGPGKVLAGLIRKISPGLPVTSIDQPGSLIDFCRPPDDAR